MYCIFFSCLLCYTDIVKHLHWVLNWCNWRLSHLMDTHRIFNSTASCTHHWNMFQLGFCKCFLGFIGQLTHSKWSSGTFHWPKPSIVLLLPTVLANSFHHYTDVYWPWLVDCSKSFLRPWSLVNTSALEEHGVSLRGWSILKANSHIACHSHAMLCR